MKPIMRWGGIILPMVTLIVIGVVGEAVSHEGKVDVSEEGSQEIIVTIGSVSSAEKGVAFTRADSLRKTGQFTEAIAAYRTVVAGGDSSELEAEAQYQIGLCYYHLGDGKQAKEAWQTVLRVYPTAGTPAAWADYGLAVLEIDRDRFQEAIARLQGILEKGYTDDTEVYAYAYYQIGRIYLAFLHKQAQAEAAFQEVLTRYPESTPAKRHFWLD